LEKTNRSLKEWNPIIEALGQGIQTILIRGYKSSPLGYLLYPTFSFTRNDNYLGMFKAECQTLAEKYAFSNNEKEIEIKYYAKIEKVIEISPNSIKKYRKHHIWTDEHVSSYLKDKKGQIWILRVYNLNKSYMVKPNRGILYSKLKEDIPISGLNPVMGDDKFSKIVEEIENISNPRR
jgi:restriction system protein